MKLRRFISLGMVGMLVVLTGMGCKTSGDIPPGFSHNLKTQGVYTTLANPDPGLDMSAMEYLQKASFAPGETPAAVIVGYGDYNQQQSVSLELVESATGRSLFTKDYYATYGKAVVQPLPLRLSGTYILRLRSGNSELDTCQFDVTRTNSSGIVRVDTSNSESKYADGEFFASIESPESAELFPDYDYKLIYTITTFAVQKAEKSNPELFVQRFPGEVAFKCRLDAKGNLTILKTLKNTLDDECGNVLAKALTEQSPYGPWPENARQRLGSDYRKIKLTIRLQ